MLHGICPGRCRANMAHIRQSRPDSGLGFKVEPCLVFKVKFVTTFEVVPTSLGRRRERRKLLRQVMRSAEFCAYCLLRIAHCLGLRASGFGSALGA